MSLYDLPPGPNPPSVLNVVVEIPTGSRNKYEYDPSIDAFRLDRVLYSAVHYPADYGFIPSSLAGDGDPADVLLMMTQASFTGCVVDARPVGMLRMEDEMGQDEKILCVPVADPQFAGVQELVHIAPHFLREVEHFFRIYKDLEGKTVETLGWEPRGVAERYIAAAIAAAGRAAKR